MEEKRALSIRNFVLILIVLASTRLAFGQQGGQQWEIIHQQKSHPLNLYVEAGWSLSSYHSTDKSSNIDFSAVSGIHIGGGVNLKLQELRAFYGLFALQAGLSYTRAGFAVDKQKVVGGYFCFPIAVQYYPMKNWYLELGMEPCLNTKVSPDRVPVNGVVLNLTNHRANDFKIGFGGGYCLESIPLGVKVNYYFGTSRFAENLPWKGNWLQIGVFYRFGI